MLRYFRASDDAYESLRDALDDAFGYPNEQTLTASCLPPAIALRHERLSVFGSILHAFGAIKPKAYVGIPTDLCDAGPAPSLLADAIASGSIEELTAEQYALVVAPPAPVRRVPDRAVT